MTDIGIRQLTADDAEAYRLLRLEALGGAPRAFGDSLEEAEGRPATFWNGLFSGDRIFFGAFRDAHLRGTCNLMVERGRKVRHKGWLLGMYVGPDLRGTGTGLKLIAALLERARAQGCTQVHLGVGDFNIAAQRLYEKAGFARYGTEPNGLIDDGVPVDEHLMVRFLDKVVN
ncbi:MAG: GNAT family N-acetyltransferase [Hyphomicrobiaceae bacterium]|nr:GNAT family N-acetyltransferase [Hyphomicrobiaceae bacterium]